MNDSTKVLYREIQERYVKVIWNHKIHLCQADIHKKNSKCHNKTLAVLSVLVSLSAITNVLKWMQDEFIVPILAVLSLTLTFFTVLFKAENLEEAALENEQFASTMHDLRNRYASLLADIKAGLLMEQQIVQRREVLEHEENLVFSGIVPSTSQEAVKEAEKSLKIKRDSTTTDKEIELIVSENLQI